MISFSFPSNQSVQASSLWRPVPSISDPSAFVLPTFIQAFGRGGKYSGLIVSPAFPDNSPLSTSIKTFKSHYNSVVKTISTLKIQLKENLDRVEEQLLSITRSPKDDLICRDIEARKCVFLKKLYDQEMTEALKHKKQIIIQAIHQIKCIKKFAEFLLENPLNLFFDLTFIQSVASNVPDIVPIPQKIKLIKMKGYIKSHESYLKKLPSRPETENPSVTQLVSTLQRTPTLEPNIMERANRIARTELKLTDKDMVGFYKHVFNLLPFQIFDDKIDDGYIKSVSLFRSWYKSVSYIRELFNENLAAIALGIDYVNQMIFASNPIDAVECFDFAYSSISKIVIENKMSEQQKILLCCLVIAASDCVDIPTLSNSILRASGNGKFPSQFRTPCCLLFSSYLRIISTDWVQYPKEFK